MCTYVYVGGRGVFLCSLFYLPSILILLINLLIIFNEFIVFSEIENRCIIASLPHVLGDKKTQKNKPGEHFWENVDVRTLKWLLCFCANVG